MKIYVTFDYIKMSRKILDEQLRGMNIKYEFKGFGEVEILNDLSQKKYNALKEILGNYGVTIVDDDKDKQVQRIKDTITNMIYIDEEAKMYKVSTYLSDKMDVPYTQLASLFSESTYTSIENFVILKKIDYVKDLIVNHNLTLTEIAYKLNYSSVAHLSAQFKKTTGLTPSTFQRIIKKRREKPNE